MNKILKRMLIGKRIEKLSLEKQKNKLLWNLLFTNIILAVSCILLIIFTMVLVTQHYPVPTKLEYNYSDLNETQIEHVNLIMSNIKSEYLKNQKKITFTNNITKLYKPFYLTKEQATEEAENLLGYNMRKSIIIKYDDDDALLIKVICHELLHSFLYSSDDAHVIIYDIDDYFTCYNNADTKINLKVKT